MRGQPIVAEPEQRYWRRRANRRVRKARMARMGLRWMAIVTLQILIASMLLAAGGRALTRIVRSEEFALQRIEVAGARRAAAERIERKLTRFLDLNLLELDLYLVGAVARTDPWVEDASVKRILPSTVRVTVEERRPVALAVISGVVHVVDGTGYVIGTVGPGSAFDLPVLTGLEGLDREELILALKRGVTTVDQLDRLAGGFSAVISELQLEQDGRITVHTVDGGPEILLDPERVERNVRMYLALREGIENRVGPLQYVDLRWQDRISVMPASKTTFTEGR